MANVLGELFGDIASAIREKTGDARKMKPADFPEKISSIETGADVSGVTATARDVLAGKFFVDAEGNLVPGDISNAPDARIETLTTEHPEFNTMGVYFPDLSVKIVPEDKTAIPTKESQTIVAEEGKVLSSVTVDPIPEEYQDVSAVDATAADVAPGKKFVDAEGNVVDGDMPTLANNTIYLTADRPYSILQKGYSDGTCKFEVLYGRKEVTPTKEAQTFSNSFIKPLVVNPIPDEYQDVSNVTATADDVRAGKVFVDAEGNEVEGALTGTIADVSEVTANAEDVLEGKIIVDSAGKKVMGALAIPEPLLQDKTITENGTYTADSGFDGLGSVIVDVLSSGSTANFVRKSFTATGTWNERISVDFGFKPDFLLIYPSSIVSLGSSNFIFIGYGEKLSQYSTSCFYISSGKFYETARGGSMESTDANKAINRADASGFYFGKSHPAGSYYVVAVGL